MRTDVPNGRVFWGAALGVVVVDLVTKLLAQRHLVEHLPVDVIGSFVRFTLAYNPGAAFSMHLGPFSRYIFGAFAVIALFVLFRMAQKAMPREWLLTLGLGLAWGGAAGNLVDRIRSPRGVVDFIDVGTSSWRFWTFNVADSAVTVGAILLAWLLSREQPSTPSETPTGSSAGTPGAA
jgi:signal peptidase II